MSKALYCTTVNVPSGADKLSFIGALLWCLHGFQKKLATPGIAVSIAGAEYTPEGPRGLVIERSVRLVSNKALLQRFLSSPAVFGLLKGNLPSIEQVCQEERMQFLRRNFKIPRLSKLLAKPEKIVFDEQAVALNSAEEQTAHVLGMPIGLIQQINRFSLELEEELLKVISIPMGSSSSKVPFYLHLEPTDMVPGGGCEISSYGMLLKQKA